MIKKILFCLVIFLKISVLSSQEITANYSFFTAGHTYGNPNSPQYGLHYPFTDFIPYLNNYPDLDLGFLTGDVVVTGTPAYWDSAQVDIDKLNMPIYIAAGNHDMGQEFTLRYGDYYYSFIYKNDLFIVLTPGLNSWNISGQQLTFLETTLENNHADVHNIFIFMHELIWWSPTNEYQNVKINFVPHYPGSTNFDDVVKPLLLSYSNNITLYAGDLGATNLVSPFMYDSFENITIIGSGMGGGVRDNVIITNVYDDSVYYDLVAINGSDPNALGELYDFQLNDINDPYNKDEINVYPNPSANGYFYVENRSFNNAELFINDFSGRQLYKGSIDENETLRIETNAMNPGVYLLKLQYNNHIEMKKVIIQ